MNAYRTKMQFRAKIAEIERQQREICKQYGLHIIPDGPEQPETGDKKTLTPRRKCGIIKAIQRHVSRWKQKQEGKTMTIYGRAITNEDMRNIAEYMNDEIREELHGKLAPCSNEKFLQEYIKRDPEILEILRNEFDFSE